MCVPKKKIKGGKDFSQSYFPFLHSNTVHWVKWKKKKRTVDRKAKVSTFVRSINWPALGLNRPVAKFSLGVSFPHFCVIFFFFILKLLYSFFRENNPRAPFQSPSRVTSLSHVGRNKVSWRDTHKYVWGEKGGGRWWWPTTIYYNAWRRVSVVVSLIFPFRTILYTSQQTAVIRRI